MEEEGRVWEETELPGTVDLGTEEVGPCTAGLGTKTHQQRECEFVDLCQEKLGPRQAPSSSSVIG